MIAELCLDLLAVGADAMVVVRMRTRVGSQSVTSAAVLIVHKLGERCE